MRNRVQFARAIDKAFDEAVDTHVRGGEDDMLLNALKNFDKDRVDLDEAVSLLAFGEQVAAAYVGNQLETPDWLTDNLGAIKKEVAARRRDNLEKELKTAQARLESLKTNEEKRTDLNAKIERLTKALA